MKLEEATNNDPWGPHGKLLAEIASATYDYEGYMEIMTSLDARFQKAIAKPERWRLAYKSLLVLEHMAKHGDARCVDGLRKEGAMRTLGRLTEFKFVDPASMKDHGINVRNRAELLRDLMKDPQRIMEERTKARANRGKYTGVSATGGGEGFGADSMGGFGSAAGDGGGAAMGGGNSSQWDSAPERKRWGSVSRGPTVAPPAESFLGETSASPVGAPAVSAGNDSGFAQRGNGGGYQAPMAVAAPEPRRPKTLSETKVNPAIAASFGGLTAPAAVAATPAPAPAAAAAAPTRAQDPMADLMGLDATPAPAAAPSPAADPFATAAPAPAAAPADPFGGAFAQTAAPAAPAADPFAAGAAAPPVTAPDAGFGAFTQMQGAVGSVPAMPMGGAPAMPMGGAPAMPMGGAPAMPMGGAPAMTMGVAPTMTMGGMGMGLGAGQGAGMFVSNPSGAAPALGGAVPSPSKAPAAKDPFADLLG